MQNPLRNRRGRNGIVGLDISPYENSLSRAAAVQNKAEIVKCLLKRFKSFRGASSAGLPDLVGGTGTFSYVVQRDVVLRRAAGSHRTSFTSYPLAIYWPSTTEFAPLDIQE
ncbi:hypothetical protein GWI33_007793 [Rhynchophorus ferrugineus]|uniref:Uncharacterized protein n=1 Tax=Rhynchophorus ferrugineus TaxID=354439 RepID=A0A834II49_RHYFE|nr:hypothetical protein GWI33_007793 [Rhynchophorus ferrugineus]